MQQAVMDGVLMGLVAIALYVLTLVARFLAVVWLGITIGSVVVWYLAVLAIVAVVMWWRNR